MAKRILILDDDEDILYFCTVIFEALNFNVTSVAQSDKILELAASIRPDIILIDNWMAGIEGSEATKLLKADSRFKEIPIVLFSAANNLHDIAHEAGANAFIQKPFDLDDLENLILSLLEESNSI